MLVKKGLMSLAIAMPLVATLAHAAHGPESIDDLRARCMEMRSNYQIRPFNIRLLCSGHYTSWEEEVGSYGLPNAGKIFTQTTCKNNRFQTGETFFDMMLPEHAGPCSRYVKKEMRAPDGLGISFSIRSCDELTAANVEAICKQELHRYCEDQFFVAGGAFAGFDQDQSSVSSSSDVAQQGFGQEGVCSLSVVEVVDTCSMF